MRRPPATKKWRCYRVQESFYGPRITRGPHNWLITLGPWVILRRRGRPPHPGDRPPIG